MQRPGISSDAVDRMHAPRQHKRDLENEELRYRRPIDLEYLGEDEVNDEDLVRYYRNGVG